jgi:crotonobetainyl-CoA:carnitine CoA-transferase CaiB-like acyl-CoA transferase
MPGRPLGDVCVLDLSLLFPGPFASQMLADLGADVISVEPPQGDLMRHFPGGPHQVVNRNKRAIALDLKDEGSRRACLRLAHAADVVIEGFRPGVADRLGVGYEQVRAGNPSVVYCSISGFGQAGPLRDVAGHDITYLCASGALSFSGHWDERPRRSGLPVSDIAGSSYAAVAILAALHERARTGEGAHLDVALADATMAFASVRGGPRMDNPPEAGLHLFPQSDLFETADGAPLAIAAVEAHFWEALRGCLAPHDERVLDPRFDDAAGRREHGGELHALIAGVIARRPLADWLRDLAVADVPAHEVLTLAEAADTPQARARGLVGEVGGERHIGFPALRDGAPMGRLERTAPAHGADTAEVLREYGVERAEAERIAAQASADGNRGERFSRIAAAPSRTSSPKNPSSS